MSDFDVFALARRTPRALALCTPGAELDYAALAAGCARATAALAERGLLAAATPLALVVRPTVASIQTLLACFAFGVPALCLSPRLPEADRDALARRAGASGIVSPDELSLASDPGPPARVALPPPTTPIEPSRPLAIIPTSGTTGQPKLVVLSRAAFAASARASAANLPLGPGDRWLLCLPLAHVGGLSIVTRSLLAGSALVPFDPGSSGLLARIDELARWVEQTHPTLLSLVPAVLDALLAKTVALSPPPGLRAVLLGGAAARPELVALAAERGLPVLTTYGLTEACSQVTTAALGGPMKNAAGVLGSGRVLPGIELRVRDDGRLCVRGPTLATSLLDAPLPLDPDGWYVTDDLGRLDADGELFVDGRASDRIVSGGENVDPLVVEACLAREPGVRNACVFGIPDARFGELVVCALAVTDAFEPARCWAALAAGLPPYARPRRVALLPELPLTGTGKLERARVRTLALPALRRWDELTRRSAETPT